MIKISLSMGSPYLESFYIETGPGSHGSALMHMTLISMYSTTHPSKLASPYGSLLGLLFWCLIVNSLTPGKSGFNIQSAIFNLVLLIDIFRSSDDNALRWMSWDLSEDKSTLVQVMAWCRQAPNHYLSQCWPRSMSSNGVTRPQWVKWSPTHLKIGWPIFYWDAEGPRDNISGWKIQWRLSGPCFNINTVFPGMGIPMVKKRRSRDRLIFIMGIFILVRPHLYIGTGPGWNFPFRRQRVRYCFILLIYIDRSTSLSWWWLLMTWCQIGTRDTFS